MLVMETGEPDCISSESVRMTSSPGSVMANPKTSKPQATFPTVAEANPLTVFIPFSANKIPEGAEVGCKANKKSIGSNERETEFE